LTLLTVIFLIVIALAAWPLIRRRPGVEQERLEQSHKPSDETERKLGRTVGFATALTILILFGLVVISVSSGKAISGPRNDAKPITIEVTGNQWWWRFRYLNDDPSRIIVTANEIHIPVGRPVIIRGTSTDVIHSFWVPNLQGKRDLIPSRVTTMWIDADRPGKFRGQCAEFCGLQHAHMSLWVVAEPEADFQRWTENQLKPAVTPSDPVKQRGRDVFLENACILCHAIQGTPAAGQIGPDLTHVGSRLTIAAGALPNNKGNLGGWITDPQTIKPGNHMATVPLQPDDLQALLDYLESLQ
jgi:cytochrome c oxidase subunit 2